MRRNWVFIFIISALFFEGASMAEVPGGFLSLNDICPSMKLQMNYATTDNFTGSVVDGYKAKKAYLAEAPAKALCLVQEEALKIGLTLKIFDSYRPVKAVTFFQTWAKLPETNPEIKKLYYPGFTRLELFEQGYIAKQSTHSRGSAVDLTLADVQSGKSLDMGTAFDFFNDLSHTDSSKVTQEQRKNRMLLKQLMESKGYKNFSQEWWHFSYRPEPYPNQYFDFDVE
jgi:D-alanyl-D-alanine dipeptidase